MANALWGKTLYKIDSPTYENAVPSKVWQTRGINPGVHVVFDSNDNVPRNKLFPPFWNIGKKNYYNDVNSVNQMITLLKKNYELSANAVTGINLLVIGGHGSGCGVKCKLPDGGGEGAINQNMTNAQAADIKRFLHKGAYVLIGACGAGANNESMQTLANKLGASVVATPGYVDYDYFSTEPWKIVNPS